MLADYETVFKAAAEATRARILKMLEPGELCVCQVMAVLGLSSSTVSKHLSILKMAGLVKDRRDGRWVYYSLETRERNPYAPLVLALLRQCLQDDPAVAEDAEKLRLMAEKTLEEICAQGSQIFARGHD